MDSWYSYAGITCVSAAFLAAVFWVVRCLLRRGRRSPTRWDFFLAHTQQNGEAKTLAAELFHEMEKLGKKCWLEVKMDKQDEDAMKDGVENSHCVLAIITGGDDLEKRYFERRMCRQELQWAIEAEKTIVPVVVADEKNIIGKYVEEGQKKGIDLKGCDFKHIDRSNPTMLKASLELVIKAAAGPPKAKMMK